MIYQKYKPFILFILFLVFYQVTFAGQTISISGKIINKDSTGIENVTVFIPELEREAVSDDEGRFIFKKVPSGTYMFVFSRIGYANVNRKINVNKQENTSFTIIMAESNIEMDAVTVTGTPSVSDPLQSTAEVDVISGKEKFKQQSSSLGQTVDKLGGVHTINTGNQTGKPVIRGLSGSRVSVLHNDIAMDYQQYGVRHMPPVDAYLARRIEVVQGPSSVLYGSDALGGAINFIPVHPHNTGKTYLKGNVMGDYQTNNNQWTTGLNLEGSTGNWGFAGGIVRRSGGNITTPDARAFTDPDGKPGDPKFTGELDHTDFDQINGTITAGHSGDYGHVSLNYTHWGNEHNFLLPNGKALGQFIGNDILQLNSTIILNEHFKLKPALTYLSNLRQSNSGGNSREQLPARSDRAHLDILRQAYSGRVELAHNHGKLSGTLGMEGRNTIQTTRGRNEPLVPGANIATIGVFAFEEYQLEKLTLTGGLRFDYRTQKAKANEALNLPDSLETKDVLQQSYSVFSGSVGANYKLTSDLSVSANAGRGFRAPSMFNLHADGVHGGIAAYQKGDPSLQPETSLNTDLSVRYRSSAISAKATVYRNAINNYMFLVNTGEKSAQGPPILQNVQGDAVITGGHITAKGNITSFLKLRGYFEMTDGENTSDEHDDVNELPLMPPYRTGGELIFSLPDFAFVSQPEISAGIDYTFQKDAAGRYEPFWQFDDNIPFGRASTDAYTLLNASLDFDIKINNNTLNFSVYGNNLANATYRDFLDTYKGYTLSPGRNIGIKVQVPFNIISN